MKGGRRMAILTFKGGVHPFDGKEISMDREIQRLEPGKELAFLLSQHIGAPAKALVSKGDTVLAGQKIAEAGGFVSAPVYSSVSGTVKGIEKRRNALGDLVDAIIITNDEKYESVPFEASQSLADLEAKDILAKIREAGVVGMGGAGFPTAVKMAPKHPEQVDYLLVNGCECEPYLTSDYRCMVEYPEKLVKGLLCMLKVLDHAKGVICIEDNKPEAIRRMQKAIENEPRMQVAVLKTKYPEGAERCLINAVTGRELNSRMLPADVGCVVDNVGTVLAIYDAVMEGKPLTERVFTLTGDAPAQPGNYLVKIGMSYAEIIEKAGGWKQDPEKIISGGPMMGFALYDTSVPVTKTSGGITCFTRDEVVRNEESACINCGRCVSGCPERLVPSLLSDFAEHNDAEKFMAYDGLECVECGSCSFSCPAKRPLAANIKAMRRSCMAAQRKKA